MSDNHNDQTAPDASSSDSVIAGQELKKAASRRRLLKTGVSVAPIVLTLASRPVLAWHCKSTSAWGSEQLNANHEFEDQ